MTQKELEEIESEVWWKQEEIKQLKHKTNDGLL